MTPSPPAVVRPRLVFPLLALAVVSAGACRSDPVAPGGGSATVRFQPVLPDISDFPSLVSLVIDEMQVSLLRPATEESVLDTTVALHVDSNSVRLRILVPVEGQADTLSLFVGLSAAGLPLFAGGREIVVRPGPALGTVPQIPLSYVGPGAGVASLVLTPLDTLLTLGDLLPFSVQALDAAGNIVPDFYVSWSTSDPALAPINAAGVLTAPLVRGDVTVTARTPSGVSTSTKVTFIPLPSQLVKVLGDNQSGLVGQLLQDPLAVEVRGDDGLGIPGIPVRFRPLTGSGRVTESLVMTDANGRAQTLATLGLLGLNTFEASVDGLPPVTFSATALDIPPPGVGGTDLD